MRGSVVECGGKPWRDTAVACRTAHNLSRPFYQRSTAVSPMPDGSGIFATALHDAIASSGAS